MNALELIGLVVGWLALAFLAAVLIGRMIALRDKDAPRGGRNDY